VTYSSFTVKVAGINPFNNTVAIQYPSQIYSTGINPQDLYVDGCVRGVCTGDSVIYASFELTIAGVNPYTGKYSVKYPSGIISAGIDLGSLSLTNYCEKYGADDEYRSRGTISYPSSGSWNYRARRSRR
jgi:hypothetical protein